VTQKIHEENEMLPVTFVGSLHKTQGRGPGTGLGGRGGPGTGLGGHGDPGAGLGGRGAQGRV